MCVFFYLDDKYSSFSLPIYRIISRICACALWNVKCVCLLPECVNKIYQSFGHRRNDFLLFIKYTFLSYVCYFADMLLHRFIGYFLFCFCWNIIWWCCYSLGPKKSIDEWEDCLKRWWENIGGFSYKTESVAIQIND